MLRPLQAVTRAGRMERGVSETVVTVWLRRGRRDPHPAPMSRMPLGTVLPRAVPVQRSLRAPLRYENGEARRWAQLTLGRTAGMRWSWASGPGSPAAEWALGAACGRSVLAFSGRHGSSARCLPGAASTLEFNVRDTRGRLLQATLGRNARRTLGGHSWGVNTTTG